MFSQQDHHVECISSPRFIVRSTTFFLKKNKHIGRCVSDMKVNFIAGGVSVWSSNKTVISSPLLIIIVSLIYDFSQYFS